VCHLKAIGIVSSDDLAEDAVHDAFVEVIKHKEKAFGKSEEELKAWLLTIVKNKALDILRKQRHVEDIDELELQSSARLTDIQVIDNIMFERLLGHIHGLDEKYKTVLEMKYILDMTNAQIARSMNITAKNVEMRLYRAKTMLRNAMESEVAANV
jgi:RNA polymerase sigma-70 factor (ECF subfamily)